MPASFMDSGNRRHGRLKRRRCGGSIMNQHLERIEHGCCDWVATVLRRQSQDDNMGCEQSVYVLKYNRVTKRYSQWCKVHAKRVIGPHIRDMAAWDGDHWKKI